MKHNMPPDIRDEHLRHSEYNDQKIRGTNGTNSSTHVQNPSYGPQDSHRSPHNAGTTGESMSMPLPAKGHTTRRTRTRHPSIFGLPRQATGSEGTGDFRAYAPSPPFEEAGPTSGVWRAYLDESAKYDADIVAEQKGELNFILVFAGLFSAIVTAFVIQSSGNLEPDYQKMTALLLFDQINIQRALANGTSLDDIITSDTDPTAPFTPKSDDASSYWVLLTSLILSLVTAFFAILVDARYHDYLSPIDGQLKFRAHTRHLRYKGIINWHIRASIGLLQFLLQISFFMFLFGLANSVGYIEEHSPSPTWIMICAVIFLCSTGCSYSSFIYISLLNSRFKSQQASQTNAANKLRMEYEVDALQWLYLRSSSSAAYRLVIQALAGFPPDYIARAKEVFHPLWDEIRGEKDSMLMDCMELSRDGTTRWIPKDIHNIDSRIEPLLRLEILFPELHTKFPSRLFGEHNLDFSTKLSNTLSITLSAIDEAHIQKPVEQNQVLVDALLDNSIHHPVVWKKLLDRYVDKAKLLHDLGDGFTVEMCLNLVTNIYLPEASLPELCSCTLAYALVASHKKEILKGLLAFLPRSKSHNVEVDRIRRLSLAIVRALVPIWDESTCKWHHRSPFRHESTISKYRLLCVAFHAINKHIHYHLVDLPSEQWRTMVFWEIVSFIKSDLFTGYSLSNSEDSELKDLFWTCRAYALAFMVSFMGGGSVDCIAPLNLNWAAKPLFLNILEAIYDERVGDAPPLSTLRFIPDFPQSFDSIIGIVSVLLGKAFSLGIPSAYEAFEQKHTLWHIADNSRIHPEIIEGLCGYITGLSKAKAGKLLDIRSDDLLDRHIKDLCHAPVIRCICASITRSGTPSRPILCTLASIAPYHDGWSHLLQTLNSPDHEYSVQRYTLHPTDTGTPDDVKRWKKDMKKIVGILAKCLEKERGRNMDINQGSTSSNHFTGELKTHHGSGFTMDPNRDVELGVIRSGNIDAT